MSMRQSEFLHKNLVQNISLFQSFVLTKDSYATRGLHHVHIEAVHKIL